MRGGPTPVLACIDGWVGDFFDATIRPTLQQHGGQTLLAVRYVHLCKQHGCKPNSKLLEQFDQIMPAEEALLNELDLSHNYLGHGGLCATIDLLGSLPGIQHLNLVLCDIQPEHIVRLQRVVSGHPGLRSIDLSHNPLSVASCRGIAQILNANQNLCEVTVEHTAVDDAWRQRIESLCQRNARRSQTRQGRPPEGEPPGRPFGSWKYVRVYLSASQAQAQPELTHFRTTVVPKLNLLLNALCLRFIPVHLAWDLSNGITQPMLKTCQAAIDGCRDTANHSLPWFIIFHAHESDSITEEEPLPVPPISPSSSRADDPVSTALSLFRIETSHGFLTQFGQAAPAGCTPTVFLFTCVAEGAPKPAQSTSFRGPGKPGSRPADLLTITSWLEKLRQCPVVQQRHYPPGLAGRGDLELLAYTDVLGAAQALYGRLPARPETPYAPSKAIPPSLRFFAPGDFSTYMSQQQEVYVRWKAQHYSATLGLPLQALLDTCLLESPFLLFLVGPPGWGKSSLLAQMCLECSRSDMQLIYFFAGATPDSTLIQDVLLYLYAKLCAAMHAEVLLDSLSSGATVDLPHLFTELLQEPPPMQLMVLIDGLDAIDYRCCAEPIGNPAGLSEASLAWIPTSVHRKIRLVFCTSSQSPSLQLLRQRSTPPFELSLPALMPADRPSCPIRPFVMPYTGQRRVMSSDDTTDDSSRTLENYVDQQLLVWEEDYGVACVRAVLLPLALQPEGLPLDELEALCADMLADETADQRENIPKFLIHFLPICYIGPPGLVQLTVSTLRTTIERRYRVDVATVVSHWSSVAHYHLTALDAKDYRFLRALERLPEALMRSGNLPKAYDILTSIEFMEHRVQAGLHWLLRRDYAMLCQEVAISGRFALEAAGDGSRRRLPNHFRGSLRARTLFRYADLLRQHQPFLRSHPSICQLGCGLPPSHPWFIAVNDLSVAGRIPYPLLVQCNRGISDERSQLTLHGHNSAVVHAHFAPSGTSLITTSRSGEVIEWEAEHGIMLRNLCLGGSWLAALYRPDGGGVIVVAEEELGWWTGGSFDQEAELKGYVCSLTPHAFNPDGRTMAAVDVVQSNIHMVDVLDGTVVGEVPRGGDDHVHEVIFSAPGNVLLACQGTEVCVLCDGASAVYRLHRAPVSQIATSSDGTLVATAHDTNIHVWSCTTQQPLQMLTGHSGNITALSFSNMDTHVLSGSEDGTVRLWRLSDGEAVRELHSEAQGPLRRTSSRGNVSGTKASSILLQPTSQRQRVGWCSFAAGCRYIVARVESVVVVWDGKTFDWVDTLIGHVDSVNWLALNPISDTVATTSDDRSAKIWDLSAATGHSRRSTTTTILQNSTAHHTAVQTLDISADGHRLCTASRDGDLKVWQLDDPEGPLIVHLAGGWSLPRFVCGPRGTQGLVAVRGKGLHFMNADTGVQDYTVPMAALRTTIFALATAPTGKSIALLFHVRNASEVHVLSLPKGDVVAKFDHANELAVGLRFLSPTSLLSYTREGTVMRWNLKSPADQALLLSGAGPLAGPVFYCDSTTCVLGVRDGTIKVVSLAASNCIATLRGHALPVVAIDVSPHGRFLLSGAEDHTLRLWQMWNWKCAAVFVCKGVPTVLRFLPLQVDDYSTETPERVIAADSMGAVNVFDIIE
eukprot:GGOE01051946.1.p1 GENE.GGOE01051946.1~~GGOE01051946.1.p1  ORF type:complete len:1639 (+),score=388.20 GGOE01051946.1:72-4988(+)